MNIFYKTPALREEGAPQVERFTAAAIQFAPVPMDVEANLQSAKTLIESCVGTCGARLVVLPESFTTGFTPVGGRGALYTAVSPMPGRLTDIGCQWAREYGTYIVFPSYEQGENGEVLNSAALLGPDEGLIGVYRKTHPFPSERISGDCGWTTPGRTPFCASTKLGKIGIVICYDGDFPELVRSTALMGAEVVARPSAFMRTFDHWELTNRARAYDNHVYFIAANSVGPDPGGSYCFGGSMIVDPRSVKLAQARGCTEYIWAELDPDPLRTVWQGTSGEMTFDHMEDRNLHAYENILTAGKSAFEPASRTPYRR